MKLTLIDEENELMQVFKKASSQSSKKVLFRKAVATTNFGRRLSTLDAYLKPALNRRNLHVLLKTKAVSVSFIFISPISYFYQHMVDGTDKLWSGNREPKSIGCWLV